MNYSQHYIYKNSTLNDANRNGFARWTSDSEDIYFGISVCGEYARIAKMDEIQHLALAMTFMVANRSHGIYARRYPQFEKNIACNESFDESS